MGGPGAMTIRKTSKPFIGGATQKKDRADRATDCLNGALTSVNGVLSERWRYSRGSAARPGLAQPE
jgi:hypothetical protein